MLEEIKKLALSVRMDEDGNYTAILKPEYACDGSRVLKTDAKKAAVGKWVTMNGAKVLIKGGKFVNGPFAGKTYKAGMSGGGGGKYFSSKAEEISSGGKAMIASACAEMEEKGSATIYFNNYKVELKKSSDFPKSDKVVVTAHNIVEHAGNNKNTVTKHSMNEVGDRLVSLHNLIKPDLIRVPGSDKSSGGSAKKASKPAKVKPAASEFETKRQAKLKAFERELEFVRMRTKQLKDTPKNRRNLQRYEEAMERARNATTEAEWSKFQGSLAMNL